MSIRIRAAHSVWTALHFRRYTSDGARGGGGGATRSDAEGAGHDGERGERGPIEEWDLEWGRCGRAIVAELSLEASTPAPDCPPREHCAAVLVTGTDGDGRGHFHCRFTPGHGLGGSPRAGDRAPIGRQANCAERNCYP